VTVHGGDGVTDEATIRRVMKESAGDFLDCVKRAFREDFRRAFV
jgi:hypothetical protein